MELNHDESLAKETYCFPMRLYQNFWCPEERLEAVINFQNNFQAYDSDIFIINMPKTGTTWMKSLLFSVINRFKYQPSNTPLLTHNRHELVPAIILGIYFKDKNPDLTRIPPPRLFACHIPFDSLPESVKNSKSKIIYVARNPFDTFVSSWHFHSKLEKKNYGTVPNIDEYFDKFCQGRSLFGPYFDQVVGYWKLSLERPEKVLFLKYEDLKQDGIVQVKKMAEFVGLPFSQEEEKDGVIEEIIKLCSIEKLKELEVNMNTKRVTLTYADGKDFFRKGEVGDWVNLLTPEMFEKLNKIMEDKLRGTGLSFSN